MARTRLRSRDNIRGPGPGPGLGVDAFGGHVIDPTANVYALVDAAIRRQDDLRSMSQDDERYISELRAMHASELVRLSTGHAKELREAETARLNAIRQVDVQQRDSQAATAQNAITALAANISSVAETLRAAAAQMAASLAAQSAAQNEVINKRLTSLEQSSYVGAGKQQVADPQLAALIDVVAKVQQSQVSNTGASRGRIEMKDFVIAGFGFLLMLISIGSALYATLKQ